MGPSLPDPPGTLTGPARAFYDELRRMLGVVQPARLDAEKLVVGFKDDRVDVQLVHADHDDLVIAASVGPRDAIVLTNWRHEHFSPGEGEERPWTAQAVDLVAELLRGEIEVETTFRDDTPVLVRHFDHDEQGRRVELGHTGSLARLRFWRTWRRETERVSFL
jgi:hypothetical protein